MAPNGARTGVRETVSRLSRVQHELGKRYPGVRAVRLYVDFMRHGQADYDAPDQPLVGAGVESVKGDGLLLGQTIRNLHLQPMGAKQVPYPQFTHVIYFSSPSVRARQTAEVHAKSVEEFIASSVTPETDGRVEIVRKPFEFKGLRFVGLKQVLPPFMLAGHERVTGITQEMLNNRNKLREFLERNPAFQRFWLADGNRLCPNGERPLDVSAFVGHVTSSAIDHTHRAFATHYDPKGPLLNLRLLYATHEAFVAFLHQLNPEHEVIYPGSRASLRIDLAHKGKRLVLPPSGILSFNGKKTRLSLEAIRRGGVPAGVEVFPFEPEDE